MHHGRSLPVHARCDERKVGARREAWTSAPWVGSRRITRSDRSSAAFRPAGRFLGASERCPYHGASAPHSRVHGDRGRRAVPLTGPAFHASLRSLQFYFPIIECKYTMRAHLPASSATDATPRIEAQGVDAIGIHFFQDHQRHIHQNHPRAAIAIVIASTDTPTTAIMTKAGTYRNISLLTPLRDAYVSAGEVEAKYSPRP